MIRNAFPLRTGLVLFSLLAAPALAAHAAAQDAPAAQGPTVEERLAAARAEFEARVAAFDEALESRDVARINAAVMALRPSLDAVSAVRPDADSTRAFNERAARFKVFSDAAGRKRSLMASLDAADADASQSTWTAVEPALRRMEAQLPECEAAMTAPEIEAVRTRLAALRTGVDGWRAEQAGREKEVGEAAAIGGELTRADRLLARVAFESDVDSADKRIDESTAALNGAEARLKSLKSVPTAELGARVAELRADLQRARSAVAANRASASARALVSKVVRDVASMVATPESQPEVARLDAECDAARQALEANKQLPSAVAAELSEALRSAKTRLADMRRGLDAEATKKPVIEAVGSAEQAAIEASELRAAADFATADEAAARASDALRRAVEALKAVPDATWRAEMEQRIGLLAARLKRVVDAIAVGRNVAALASAVETAEADMREMAAERWKADRESIDTLMQGADIPEPARAGARRTVARLDSYEARRDALKELTGPIDAAIKVGDYAGARSLLDDLRKKVVTPPLSADHLEFLNRLMSSYLERIESGEFWRMVAIGAAVLGAVLVVAVVALWMRRSPGTGTLDLRKWNVRVAELTRRLQQDRDRATASDAVKSEATDRLERSHQFELHGVKPPIPRVDPANGTWLDTLVLAHRLVALGDAESARELLDKAEQAPLLHGPPALKWLVDHGGPLAPNEATRLARGCRAVEAAGAWADVWSGSPQTLRDLVAPRVERWFQTAVDWLPGHEDVPVFYERALFAAEQGKRDLALTLLTGERDSALARMKSLKAGAVSLALKTRIYVLAAELSLDLANVVSLRGGVTERAKSWPVLDRYQAPAPVANPTAVPGAAVPGAPAPVDPATRIMHARNYLALATQALGPAPSPGIAAAGLGAPAPYGVAAATPPAAVESISREDSASLRFLIGATTFRADLGSGQPQAELTLGDRALGEPEPTAPAVFDVDTQAGARSGLALRPGWSRLQPDIDAQLLGTDERRMVRDLRLNWVTWCLDRGNEFALRNPQALPGFMQKAAWLTCRYWLWARDSATPEAAVARGELRKLVDRILDVKEEPGLGAFGFGASGSKPKRSLGPNGWKPSAEFSSPEDRAVHALLLEIAGTEAPRCAGCGTDLGGLPPGSPCPKCSIKPKCPQCGRDTVGGRCAFCVAPPPSLGNVWLLPKEASSTPPVDGKPVINSLEVIDPTMSSTPVDGMFAWIDTGANSPVRAVGVFGHDLQQEYKVPVRSVLKPARDLFGGGKLIGMVNQLAEFTFDGLKDIVGAFAVVLSRPAQSSFGQPASSRPQDGQVVSRIQVDGFVARPAPGRQPAPTIPVDLIEGSLFDVSVVIAAIGVDAKPIPQPVGATGYGSMGSEFGTGGYGTDAGEAWHALAQFFREELGVAERLVKEELEERAKECEGKGLRASKVAGFASTILDLDFIRSMVRQLSLRAEKDRDADAKAAWARLDPTIRAAMDRLIRKFEERQRGCVSAQRLKDCFGIQIDAPPSPQPPTGDGDGPKPPPPLACARCRSPLAAGSPPGSLCSSCAKDFPLRAEFEGLVDDIRATVRGLADRQWDYALDATCLRRELGRMKSQLGDQLSKVPDSVAAQTRGYIARADAMLSRLR